MKVMSNLDISAVESFTLEKLLLTEKNHQTFRKKCEATLQDRIFSIGISDLEMKQNADDLESLFKAKMNILKANIQSDNNYIRYD